MNGKRVRRKARARRGRLVVRDAELRPAPHHEAERSPVILKRSPLILRSRAKRGVSKDEGPQFSRTTSAAALYRLMAWLSPSYPIGAFSYSSGIEWAVEAGDIRDAASLQGWLGVMLSEGSGFCDAVFFAQAHRAVAAGDEAALAAVAELAVAFASSRERLLETTAQGRAFLDTTRAAWPCAALGRSAALPEVALPVAAGAACAGHDVLLEPAVAAYLQALAAALISVGVRLVPLGQTDGQRVLAALEPVVAAAAARALATPLDELGSAAFRADIASMRHETQYTRLFRS